MLHWQTSAIWIFQPRFVSRVRSAFLRAPRGSHPGLVLAQPLVQLAHRQKELFFPCRLAPELRPQSLQPRIDLARNPNREAAPIRPLMAAIDRVERRERRQIVRPSRTARRRAAVPPPPGRDFSLPDWSGNRS